MTKLHKLSGKLLGLLLAFGLSATASAQMTINGAGATFPYPIYSKWFDDTQRSIHRCGLIINRSARAEDKNKFWRRRSILERPTVR